MMFSKAEFCFKLGPQFAVLFEQLPLLQGIFYR